MDAFASALRLPEGALPPAGVKTASDDVFIRLMGLHKGRKMLARAIRYVILSSSSSRWNQHCARKWGDALQWDVIPVPAAAGTPLHLELLMDQTKYSCTPTRSSCPRGDLQNAGHPPPLS